jgi:hypothetical protein
VIRRRTGETGEHHSAHNRHDEMKHHKTSTRGRKAGGDVLKSLEPGGAAAENALKFAYGRSADDPAAQMVRQWMTIKLEAQRLAELKETIGPKRISAAEHGAKSDALALKYWQKKRALDAWLRFEMDNLWTADQ